MPNFQKEGIDRISVLRSQDHRGWLLGKIGATFSRRGRGGGGGVLQFLHKKIN